MAKKSKPHIKGELAASKSFHFDGLSGKPSKNYEFQKKLSQLLKSFVSYSIFKIEL